LLGYANGAIGPLSSFNGPANLCMYGKFLYVADSVHNHIRKVSTNTGATSLVAGSPSGIAGYKNGPSTSALFNNSNGIAIDPMGMYRIVLYLRLFRQIIFIGNSLLSNIYLLFICIEMPDYYCKDQELCVHLCERLFIWLFFSIYLGMNLYVADSNNNVIRQIDLATLSVTTLAGGATSVTVSLKIVIY
jgi:hypothetical protein